MSDTILDKEDAILKHDSLKFAEESKPLVYRCDMIDKNGILLVTNIRMSFYYKNESGETNFLHYLFNMTSKIIFYVNSTSNLVEINSAYEITQFVIRSKFDFIEFKNFIDKNHPNILEISEINKEFKIKHKSFEKEENNQFTTDVPNFISFNKVDFLNVFKSNFVTTLINIGFIILFIYGISLLFPDFNNQLVKAFNYPSYWIGKQKTEKDMFIIYQKMVSNNDYPQDITGFILKNFKSTNNNSIAKDAWGNLYDVEYSNNKVKIISYGPDKKKNTKDDIFKEFAKINK